MIKSCCFGFSLFAASFSISACPSVGEWLEVPVIDSDGESISLYAYWRWPPYLPNLYLGPQVVVLNGGLGKVDCNTFYYQDIGSKASQNGRQAITLDLDFWKKDNNIPDRTTIKDAAAYVVDTLNKLVDDGYLRSSFYLMGISAGSAVISAVLDYHPSFVKRVERAIFISGPFTDVHRQDVTEPVITGLMDANNISQLDSLDYSLHYKPNRIDQWIKPIMNKKGLRFFVAEDDNVSCAYDGDPNCAAGTMDEEFLNWLSIATEGAESRWSLEKLGILRIYPQGGHGLFLTHPELLDDALAQ